MVDCFIKTQQTLKIPPLILPRTHQTCQAIIDKT